MPSENPSGAENEQGSLTDLAWLAGHLDGDGWIGIIRAKRPGKEYYRYTCSLMLMTTSERNAGRTIEVLESIGANVYVREQDPYLGKDGSPRRRKWTVSIRGNADAEMVLLALLPYLAEKRKCAEHVIEYAQWRSIQKRRPGGNPRGAAGVFLTGMREHAEETMRLLREDRNRHDPSETLRLAPSA